MIFTKIDYLNLLPFHIFLKQHESTQQKAIIQHHKSVPSKINKLFKTKKSNGAFISSIHTQNQRCLNLGIVAKKSVKSVISCGDVYKKDKDSATSNALGDILDTKGEILIGDKALRRFIQNSSDCQDLALLWHDRYSLPFVFAKLCYNSHKNHYKKLQKNFLKRKYNIPQYILKQHSLKSKINTQDIMQYLNIITYKLEHKEHKSLKKFLKLAKK
jgi:chorismate dehydratase